MTAVEVDLAEGELGFLLNDFVDRVGGVTESLVLTADGTTVAMSSGLDRPGADRLAAIAAGMVGLAHGLSGRFGGGAVDGVTVEMDHAVVFVTAMGDGSLLATLADSTVDAIAVGREMATLVDLAGAALTR